MARCWRATRSDAFIFLCSQCLTSQASFYKTPANFTSWHKYKQTSRTPDYPLHIFGLPRFSSPCRACTSSAELYPGRCGCGTASCGSPSRFRPDISCLWTRAGTRGPVVTPGGWWVPLAHRCGNCAPCGTAEKRCRSLVCSGFSRCSPLPASLVPRQSRDCLHCSPATSLSMAGGINFYSEIARLLILIRDITVSE